MSFDARIKRLERKLKPKGEVIFICIVGDPDNRRLGVPMLSNREALIGEDHFEAAPEESTQIFHARMKDNAHISIPATIAVSLGIFILPRNVPAHKGPL